MSYTHMPRGYEKMRHRVWWQLRGSAGVKAPAWAGAWVVWTSHWLQRTVNPGFLISLPRCGAEGEEGREEMKSCQRSNIKKWVRTLWHTLLQCEHAAPLIEKWKHFLHSWNRSWTCDLFGQYSLQKGPQIPSLGLKRLCMLLLTLLESCCRIHVSKPAAANWVQGAEPIYSGQGHPRRACH